MTQAEIILAENLMKTPCELDLEREQPDKGNG